MRKSKRRLEDLREEIVDCGYIADAKLNVGSELTTSREWQTRSKKIYALDPYLAAPKDELVHNSILIKKGRYNETV